MFESSLVVWPSTDSTDCGRMYRQSGRPGTGLTWSEQEEEEEEEKEEKEEEEKEEEENKEGTATASVGMEKQKEGGRRRGEGKRPWGFCSTSLKQQNVFV